jgi:hypothetical protein
MENQDDHEMGEASATVPESTVPGGDQAVADTPMETSLSAVSGGSSAADESALQHLNVSRCPNMEGEIFGRCRNSKKLNLSF